LYAQVIGELRDHAKPTLRLSALGSVHIASLVGLWGELKTDSRRSKVRRGRSRAARSARRVGPRLVAVPSQLRTIPVQGRRCPATSRISPQFSKST